MHQFFYYFTVTLVVRTWLHSVRAKLASHLVRDCQSLLLAGLVLHLYSGLVLHHCWSWLLEACLYGHPGFSCDRELWSDLEHGEQSHAIEMSGSVAAAKVKVITHTQLTMYHKFPKYSDTQRICCNHSKIWTIWLYHRVLSPNDADRMANSVDPDQTAPLGAVWSGSALFAQAYLSENLGSLRYYIRPWLYDIFHCYSTI